MSKGMKILVGSLAVVVLVGVLSIGTALAQESTPTPQVPKSLGRGFGFCGGGSWETFDAAAEALGLTPEQLFAELHAGKSLEEIAEAKGVDLQKVSDAMQAAQVEAMKAAIQQAVTDGKLTQEQADWLLKGLELGYMPMGRGFRFGGRGGWFFRSSPQSTTPSTTPSASPSSYSF